MRPHPALCHFQRFLQKRYGPTDRPTDGRTNGRTHPARTHLKSQLGCIVYTQHKMRPHPALRHFQRFLQKRYGPTDQPTDQRTVVQIGLNLGQILF